jgi:hypothetical protein
MRAIIKARLQAWPVGALALIGAGMIMRPISDWSYSFPQEGITNFVILPLRGLMMATSIAVFLTIIKVTDAAADKLAER